MRGFPDLSDNNGPVDWLATVPAERKATTHPIAAVKATQGDWYESLDLDQQRDGAEAHGVEIVIIYHFFEAVASGGKNQGKPLSGAANAEYLLATIGKHGGLRKNECLAIDWESEYLIDPNADLAAAQADLIGTLTRALGIQIIEYSRDDYISRHKLAIPPSRYWCAAPGATTRPDCLIWQYDWHGRIPGISTEVDLNDIADINALQPFQWGDQPDPVAGKPATGQPDLGRTTDVPTTIKHVIGKLQQNPPDVPTAIADLSQCLTTNFGLIGA